MGKSFFQAIFDLELFSQLSYWSFIYSLIHEAIPPYALTLRCPYDKKKEKLYVTPLSPLSVL